MTNYLAAIDLEDEESTEKIIAGAVKIATGVEGVRMYLMTVVPGIWSGD